MTHGSLFSGIGGFDLAAEWAGFENIFCCEIEPFCQKILKYHFPKTQLYENIKKTDFTKYRGTIDVISGGFPCQPFSCAGKREGAADHRFLWAEMLRAIRECQPKWVVAENVSGLLTIEQGVVFERILADLENQGYEVQPFIIPACAVGAPHRRDRVWIVANRTDAGLKNVQYSGQNGILPDKTITNSKKKGRRTRGNDLRSGRHDNTTERGEVQCEFGRLFENRNVADTTSNRLQERNKIGTPTICAKNSWFDRFPTQPPLCSRNDGLSDRLDGITFPAWRRKSLSAYGNAIVPQVAYQIFKVIKELL